jgi:putative chitinase
MRCDMQDAVMYAPCFTEGFKVYAIDTPKRVAAFVAQIGHESFNLRFTRELWGPTRAQEKYEGRLDLGNTQPGDGKRYMGRSPIQLTGRSNYARARDGLRRRFADIPDFEDRPDLLLDPRMGSLVSCWFWDDKGLNRFADAEDFLTLTKRINGGTNGLADRQARWERAKQVIYSDAATADDASRINSAIRKANA